MKKAKNRHWLNGLHSDKVGSYLNLQRNTIYDTREFTFLVSNFGTERLFTLLLTHRRFPRRPLRSCIRWRIGETNGLTFAQIT